MHTPVEILSLIEGEGVRLRATVSEFGPILFSQMLGLNDTQTGVMGVIFKYCDDKKLPLLDLTDLKKVIQFLANEGKKEIQKEYGRLHSGTVAGIMRKLIELEQQGANAFFGEPSFDVRDLVRRNREGKGVISILRLVDLQDRPKLFSIFMLALLAEVYATFLKKETVTNQNYASLSMRRICYLTRGQKR